MSGLHHIALLCFDREKSLGFYKSLGFTVEREIERRDRHDIMIFLRGFGIVLEMFISKNNPQRPTDPESYGARHICFCTENAEKLRDELIKKGLCPEEIREDTVSGGRLFFVKDPDGLPIEFHE